MRCVKAWAWLVLSALWAGSAAARPDLIFQVPEVLVRHAAAPRPVGTSTSTSTGAGAGAAAAASASRANDSAISEGRLEGTHYYVEHDISTADAKKAARMMKLSEVAESRPGCGKCSRREMEYCESGVLADHCCCEQRFLREPFPWVPHTCYLGPERCDPLATNCAAYARIRDCCCYRKMAEKWKGILSSASPVGAGGAGVVLLALAVLCL